MPKHPDLNLLPIAFASTQCLVNGGCTPSQRWRSSSRRRRLSSRWAACRFCALLWLVARRLSPPARLVIAVALEATWEVFENTPFTINRYRAATISLDYYGDSIINSMSDIASMLFGFWIARRLPVWASVVLVVVLEVAVGAIIRDNLTLNILMLIHPFEIIKRWQLAV